MEWNLELERRESQKSESQSSLRSVRFTQSFMFPKAFASIAHLVAKLQRYLYEKRDHGSRGCGEHSVPLLFSKSAKKVSGSLPWCTNISRLWKRQWWGSNAFFLHVTSEFTLQLEERIHWPSFSRLLSISNISRAKLSMKLYTHLRGVRFMSWGASAMEDIGMFGSRLGGENNTWTSYIAPSSIETQHLCSLNTVTSERTIANL